jgi:hypothetical protein
MNRLTSRGARSQSSDEEPSDLSNVRVQNTAGEPFTIYLHSLVDVDLAVCGGAAKEIAESRTEYSEHNFLASILEWCRSESKISG